MKPFSPLARLTLAAVAFLLAVSALATSHPVKAVEADTFYLSWPYVAPPKGHLNSISPDNLTNGGFGPWSYLLEPTMGYYLWAKGEYKGWLAKEWGFSADGKKYTIKLHPDLTWSDGAKITSKDVVATFNLFRIRGSAIYTVGVDKVVAVDETTIDYMLNQPPGPVLERSIMKETVLSYAQYGKFADKAGELWDAGIKAGKAAADIRAADDWKALEKETLAFRPEKTISSGPYTLEMKDVQTAQLIMRRSDKTKFGKMAKFEKVVVYAGDTEVTTPLLLAGELYYATDYFPPPVEKSLIDKGVKILRAPTLSGPAIQFNVKVAPLDKVEVRQAFAYAVDRNRVTKVSYGDIGRAVKYLANYSDSRLPNFLTADQIAKFNTYSYDLKKADELMQKAGYKKNGDFYADASGKTLELELSAPADFTDWMPAAQDAVEQLNAFGVKVTLRAIPNNQHAPEVRAGKFQLAIRLWGFPNPIPFYAYRNTYRFHAVAKGANDPGMGYPLKVSLAGKDYDLDALITTLGAGTDVKPQTAAMLELATAYNADLPMIPLVERFYNTPLVDKNFTGHPAATDDFWGNVSGSDNAIVILLMEGTISPKK
jgi:peptide/nickel transport system substrate-binding protein